MAIFSIIAGFRPIPTLIDRVWETFKWVKGGYGRDYHTPSRVPGGFGIRGANSAMPHNILKLCVCIPHRWFIRWSLVFLMINTYVSLCNGTGHHVLLARNLLTLGKLCNFFFEN